MSEERVLLSEAERLALRVMRRQKRIRIKTIARALQVHERLIMHWEAGTRTPTVPKFAGWKTVLEA